MKELISLLMIGISLSMDTFSLSLSVGALAEAKEMRVIPFTVGLFHFFMPLLGNLLGLKLVLFFHLASHVLLGFILIVLAIQLAIHYFKEEEVHFHFHFLGVLLFALSVSFDSFTVGMGISAITKRYIVASSIFAICSACFTSIGITIGKYSNKMIGKYATLIGIGILFLLGLYHLF